MKCSYCAGEGIDPYDNDPLGGSMNSPCPRCDGTGLSHEERERKRDELKYRPVDQAFERNR